MKQTKYFKALVTLMVAGSLATISGCSGLNSSFKLPEHKIDYGESQSVKSLEIPPELTTPEFDDTYTVSPGSALSAAAYERQAQAAKSDKVLPSVQNLKIVREGNVRWIHAQASADSLWPRMREFWNSIGITLKKDEPRIGIMETEWAENRAGLPMDWFRKTLGKVFQDVYDAGTRDQYRLRVEKPAANQTNIFIAHRRAEEMVDVQGGVKWEMRPSDPEIEAEILNRLAAYLQGSTEGGAITEEDLKPVAHATLTEVEGHSAALKINNDFKRAWVRTGVTLDRIGMSIEKQEKDNGIYHITYRGDEGANDQQGWFSRVFKRNSDTLIRGTSYQMHLAGSGNSTLVTVTDVEGQPVSNEVSNRVLGRLKEELER